MIKYQIVNLPHGGLFKKYHTDAPQPQSVFYMQASWLKTFPSALPTDQTFYYLVKIF